MDTDIQTEYDRLKADLEAKAAASAQLEKDLIDGQLKAEQAWRETLEAKKRFNRFRVDNGL